MWILTSDGRGIVNVFSGIEIVKTAAPQSIQQQFDTPFAIMVQNLSNPQNAFIIGYYRRRETRDAAFEELVRKLEAYPALKILKDGEEAKSEKNKRQ